MLIAFFLINSFQILLIDWYSSMEIGSNVKYSGTLSTASSFILEELTNNRNSSIECLPIDDCILLMKMIFLEIIPKSFREALSSEIRQGSFSGILAVHRKIKRECKDKQSILLEVIDLLEKHRRSLNDEKLNYFIDQCLENRRCLFELENQQTDVNYFKDSAREIFSS